MVFYNSIHSPRLEKASPYWYKVRSWLDCNGNTTTRPSRNKLLELVWAWFTPPAFTLFFLLNGTFADLCCLAHHAVFEGHPNLGKLPGATNGRAVGHHIGVKHAWVGNSNLHHRSRSGIQHGANCRVHPFATHQRSSPGTSLCLPKQYAGILEVAQGKEEGLTTLCLDNIISFSNRPMRVDEQGPHSWLLLLQDCLLQFTKPPQPLRW
mmetsp:Transcript_14209/g.39373  ORF Transcript_14209/g.39373 Transcript_14209/m.39373 type:complete len:208 (+) Transcript_14209:380-1003(+)